MQTKPTIIFEIYRWAGTTPEAFREHYEKTHQLIAKSIPGVVWYETFFNNDPQVGVGLGVGGWPHQDVPRPDAFAIAQCDSQASFEASFNHPAWLEAGMDDIGFCSHFKAYSVDRCIWLSEHAPPPSSAARED